MIDPEKLGFVLWEAMTLLSVILGGLALMVMRRRASRRPAFTNHDRQLFFGRSKRAFMLVNFGIAVFLCFLTTLLEMLILAPLGAGPLAVVLLLTFLAIVNKMLC